MFRRANILLAAFVMLSTSAAFAQSSMPPERPKRESDPDEFYRAPSTVHGKTILVPIGTTWEGRMSTTISSARSHPGTAFDIIMSSPVILNGTEVVVPAGSAIVGEVVEAVPASSVPKTYMQDKRTVRGKLRIQISGLRTPDGVMHPLVASVAGEVDHSGGNDTDWKPPLGTSIGYVGSSSSFEAVNINRARPSRNDSQDHRPNVVTKRDLLADPLLGAGEDGYRLDRMTIRSLVLNKRDYYIYSGSPLSVRLQAPFKISIGSPGMGAPIGNVREVDDQLPPPTRASAGGFGGGEQSASGGGFSRSAPPQPQSSVPSDGF
jgi:hypothetical protein